MLRIPDNGENSTKQRAFHIRHHKFSYFTQVFLAQYMDNFAINLNCDLVHIFLCFDSVIYL